MSDNPQENQKHEVEPDTTRQSKERTNPIPEPRFSVNVKKTRQEVTTQETQAPLRLPFKLEPMIVSSKLVSPLRLLAGLREDWELRPVSPEWDDFEIKPETPVPRLNIWESPRIHPTTPLHDTVESVEINLPPRPLLSVESLEVDSDDQDTSRSPTEKREVEAEEEAKNSPEQSPASAELARSESGVSQSLPDLYDFLFKTPEGDITAYEPLCLVAAKRDDEQYKQTLETLCREQFRQHVGGKPLADLLTEPEATTIEETRIENRIVSYDDSDSEFFDFEAQLDEEITRELLEDDSEVNLERLHLTVDEFFTHTLGYLLLFVEDRYADVLYHHLRSVEDIRESNQIVSLHLRQLPDDVKRDLVSLAWGNVQIDTDNRDLDSLFHTGEDNFRESIEPSGSIQDITRRDVEGTESRLHYWIKCFVVDVLLSKHGRKPVDQHDRPDLMTEIQTEEQPWGQKNPRPDIYDSRKKEAFEVETLYGTDHKKIDETIDGYEGTNVKQVNIVLPNLTCLRNLDDVLRKTQEESGEMYRNDVEFWTLNLDDGELLPIEEMAKTLSELNDRCEPFL